MADTSDIPSFHLELESENRNQFRVRLIDAPDGGRKSQRYWSASPLAQTYRGTPESVVRELGWALYKSVFLEEIGKRFDECRRRLCSNQGDERVRLRVVFDIQTSSLRPDPLFDCPWELLHDGDDWLALDRRLSITRRLNTRLVSAPGGRDIHPPLRMLLAYAEPQDKGSVWGSNILNTISAAIEPVIERLELVSLPHITAKILGEKVKGGFHIIHFLGHGALETEKAVMGLIFPELPEGGTSDIVTASEFKRWVEDARYQPKLVVLTACHSSSAGGFSNLGLAQALLDAGVEAVVAMQTELWTDEAEGFAHAFYGALANHSRIDDAMQVARHALKHYWKDRSLTDEVARVLVLTKGKQRASTRVQYALAPVGCDTAKNVFPFPGWAVPTLFLQGDGWLGQGPPESPITWEKDRKEMVYVEERCFYIDKYPVTCREYQQFLDKEGLAWDAPPWKGEENGMLPATNLTWGDAQAYATWAGKHLPSVEEWQQAALSGLPDKTLPYPWGHDFRPGYCNTRERGCQEPISVLAEDRQNCNPSGVCGIVGNIAEWAVDEGSQARICGGSYKDLGVNCTIQRKREGQAERGVGFRCIAHWSDVIHHQPK
jgi:hypothetical protein